LARAVSQVGDVVAAWLPQCSLALPAAVEEALRMHLDRGLRAMEQVQTAPHAPALRSYLAQAVVEWHAALALLQEWTAPE
jgi:hypothetical protein